MAAITLELVERRGERRVPGGGPRWKSDAVLRPGLAVVILNISRRGALVESSGRLRPGARTELQVASEVAKAGIKGRLDRCQVAALEPLRYRGVLLFDECVELE